MEKTEQKFGFNQNSNYITGGGTGKAYIKNKDQSTTGNIYGIYDMRGGAYEYVASYYNVSSSNLSNGSSFASKGGSSDEYSTVYTGTNTNSAYKYGDATYETSGWHGNYAHFVDSSGPFFGRGGYYNRNESGAGIFYFTNLSRKFGMGKLVSFGSSSVM